MEDILVPLGFFAIVPIIIWTVSYFRSKNHAKTAKVLQQLIDRGDAITPETVRALGVRAENPHRDLKIGLILIAIAIAVVIFGSVVPDPSDHARQVMIGIASFPFLVGLVYCVFWFMFGRKAAEI